MIGSRLANNKLYSAEVNEENFLLNYSTNILKTNQIKFWLPQNGKKKSPQRLRIDLERALQQFQIIQFAIVNIY